jgi:hypothetical protein
MSAARTYTTTRGPEGTAATPRLVPAQSMIAARPPVPMSVLFLGVVGVLVAAWGAAAPFAGPDFGYVADRVGAWQWSVTSACLGLGPGGLATLASLAVIMMAMRTSYARRVDLWALGLVVTLCGAWFVVGQYVWPVVYGTHYIAPSSTTHFMWKELAFAIGPGVILVFCGAVFMGWATRRQLALVADRYPRSAVSAPGTVAPDGTVRPRATGPSPSEGSTGTASPPLARPIPDPGASPAATTGERRDETIKQSPAPASST